MTDRDPLQRFDPSGRKPQIATVASLSGCPGRQRLASCNDPTHDRRLEVGKWGIPAKTKSSYQGEEPTGAGAGFLMGDAATRSACLRQWFTSGRLRPDEVASALALTPDDVDLIVAGTRPLGMDGWAALAALVKDRMH